MLTTEMWFAIHGHLHECNDEKCSCKRVKADDLAYDLRKKGEEKTMSNARQEIMGISLEVWQSIDKYACPFNRKPKKEIKE